MTDNKQKLNSAKEDVSGNSESASASTYEKVDTSSEASEFADNLPAETGEKTKEDKGVASSGKKDGEDQPANVTQLKPIQFPSPRAMKGEVENALSQEKARLISEAAKYERKGDFFELNKAVSKIREISQTILELARMTYDALKGLWLKYVYKE